MAGILSTAERYYLRGLLEIWSRRLKLGGTYAVTQGPRLETPAEIRMIASLGCGPCRYDPCPPKVFLARELEISYQPVCYVTNMAEGIARTEYRGGVLFEGMLSSEERGAVEGAVDNFPADCRFTGRMDCGQCPGSI